MKSLYGTGVYVIGKKTYNFAGTSKYNAIGVSDEHAVKLLELRTSAPGFEPIILEVLGPAKDVVKKVKEAEKLNTKLEKEAAKKAAKEAAEKPEDEKAAELEAGQKALAKKKEAAAKKAETKRLKEEADDLIPWDEKTYHQKKGFATRNGKAEGHKATELEEWYKNRK